MGNGEGEKKMGNGEGGKKTGNGEEMKEKVRSGKRGRIIDGREKGRWRGGDGEETQIVNNNIDSNNKIAIIAIVKCNHHISIIQAIFTN